MGFVRHREAKGAWKGVAPREYTSGAVRQVLVGRDDGATPGRVALLLDPGWWRLGP